MVKGYRLKDPPDMCKYTELDILSEIDVLREVNKIIPSASGSEKSTVEYKGLNLHVIITEYYEDNQEAIDSVMTVATVLEEAVPDLLKVFVWNGNKVVLAFPSDNINKESIYLHIINELLRVTTYIISEFNSGECMIPPVDRVKKYKELFLKW